MTSKIDSFPGREIVIKGKKFLYFGGTAYFGTQTDREFQNIFITNIKKYGTGYGASRKSNVQLSIYREAENYLSNWVGCEDCATLSSGYLAGQLICNLFSSKQYRLFYTPNSHSALYQTNIKPYITYSALNIALRDHLASNTDVIPVILLDSIDFSGYNYPQFQGLTSLPLDKCILVADDSHGIGQIGPENSGVFQILARLKPLDLLICCSLGKALGIDAGAIFGTSTRIKEVLKTDFYAGASPASPASMATLIQAEEIYKSKKGILDFNMVLFLNELNDQKKFTYIEGFPVFGYSDPELTKFLLNNSIIVTDFNYPSEDASLKSRIVLTASHAEEDIKKLTSLINSFYDKELN
ncbi:pyridoxal phosphate-dependent aminotransferase family protein [uncultured Eudoraea sp.]|uniref:pyridoxal phosphate-dependent aminotransferase family protein n=1 Tax=uncultured Eudoraea sp. TaxID=1035614 RepID=UPI00260EF92D|nr:pyridoxal phosphate-dependent aminotransferase family protein [uncultured Eudoraea sp.]